MKYYKFLFDLDETLVTGDLIKKAADELFLNGQLERTYNGSDSVDFAMSNLPDILRERTSELFCDPIKGCLEKKPISGVFWFLQYLTFIGHQVGVLTSRPEPLHEPTKYALLRDFPEIDWRLGIHFANKRETCDLANAPSKAELISEIYPDFYFDDHFEYCLQARRIMNDPKKVFLIRNKHTGYNKNTKPEEHGIEVLRNPCFFDEKLIWDTKRDRIMHRHTR